MGFLTDIGRGVAQIGDRRFLTVLVRALVLTALALALAAWAFVAGIGGLLPESVELPWIGSVAFLDDLAFWAAVGGVLVLSVFLMVPVAAAVVGFFLEGIAEAVEERHYPSLPPARKIPLATQIGDALRFFGLVVAVNLFALAIYLTLAPLAPFVFWIVNGFLLGREYFQLVALRRADPLEAKALRNKHFATIWLTGTAMAIPLSIPIVNLFVPIAGVAVFTHQFHRLTKDAPYVR
jgi:CysZ protein